MQIIFINFRQLIFSVKKARGKCILNRKLSFSSYISLMTLTDVTK